MFFPFRVREIAHVDQWYFEDILSVAEVFLRVFCSVCVFVLRRLVCDGWK